MSLKMFHSSLLKLQDDIDLDPLSYATFTPCQEEFLRCKAKFFLLRGGNQIGKSFAGAAEIIWRCLGTHPYKKTTSPPIMSWAICHSWSQSVEVQERIWNLLPKGELCDDMQYVHGKGFRGNRGSPIIRFRNGSIIRIKTTNQTGGGNRGTISLSAGTCDYVWIDEPPPPPVWSEVVARVLRKTGSSVAITMTPVGVPVDFLKKMVDDGTIIDIHGPLTVENVTPKGCSRSLLSQEQIDSVSKSYLHMDRDCRMLGAWEGFAPMGLIFADFSDDMITSSPMKGGNWKFSVGIDHGSSEGAQFAILCGVRYPDPTNPDDDYELIILDEYASGADKSVNHARGILKMLERNRLEPKHISRWTGDRPHRGDKHGGRMSNKMLRSAFEHVLQYPRGRGFYIYTAYKPAFSVYFGCRVLGELMAKRNFWVHPRCKNLILSLKRWSILKSGRMDTASDYTHSIDACRYAAMPLLDIQYRQPRKTHIKILR